MKTWYEEYGTQWVRDENGKQQENDAKIPKYTVSIRCTNCGHKSILSIPKGTERPQIVDCPVCECHTARTNW